MAGFDGYLQAADQEFRFAPGAVGCAEQSNRDQANSQLKCMLKVHRFAVKKSDR